MNRDEALQIFVRQHLRHLTDRNAARQDVKNLRQKFFEKHSLPAASRFSNNEVATQVLGHILKVKNIRTMEDAVNVVESIPFLKDECHEHQIVELLHASRFSQDSLLSPEDLRKIGQEEYLSKVEHSFEERAKAKALSQLDREREELAEMKKMLQEEKKSLEAYKSALDSLPPDLDADEFISKELAARTDDSSGIWWKNLGLESDPFGSNQGLFGIPPEKYDEVVVQTPFVKSYLTRIREAPKELLGKTIVMLGDFGSGKTTIFQLVAHTAGKSKFLPVLATINPDQNIEKLLKQFTTQLSSRICDAYPLRIQLDRQPSLYYDDIGWCIQVMDLARKSGTEGFMVFIDGLHKSETYMKQSLEFLQHIQNFQERAANSGVSCGILIAGSPAWEVELKSNPSLSGSYYSIERVPPLSEEAAVEAVVRRINSFLAPGTPRPSIEPRQLRNAFSILSTRLYRPPTFRDYLDHIRSRLIAGEFDNLGISISLHTETVEYVKKEIIESPLAGGYSRLVDPRRHTYSFRRVVSTILPLIHMRGKTGIAETEPIFRENTGAFLVLLNEGFIAPHRSPDRLSLAWYLSPELIAFLQSLQRKNNMLPQDVLNALFADESKIIPKESESYYGGVKSLLKELSASWRSSWPEVSAVLEDCVDKLARIDKLCEKPDTLVSENLLENLRSTLKAMIKSIMFVLGRKDAMVDDQIFERFYESWIAPENRDSYRSILDQKKGIPKDLPHCFGLMHQHSQAMNDLCKILTDVVKGEAIVRLVGRSLTTDEITKLHEARTLFLSTQYVETVSKVADILDRKTKDILYVALRCHKGDGYLSLIPNDIRGRYTSNDIGGHPRTKRSKDQNIFYDMNRSEYSKILFQKSVRRLVLEDTIDDVEIAQLKNAWEIVFSLADRDAHNDRPSYFRRHSTEISSVLQWTPKLCEMLNKTIDKLVLGEMFSYEKLGSNSIKLRFGEKTDSDMITIHEAEVEAIVFELLVYADESHEIHVPPLESLLGVFNYTPEKVVGLLRASVGQGLLSIEKVDNPFALTVRITPKGRERLDQLKLKRKSRIELDPSDS